jgi:UDP-2,3-diacylglucosamine pyrophosphatase LpxH
VKAAVNYITDFEVGAAKLAQQNNCSGVICGHIHKPEDRQIAGVHYLNSGDWVENLTAILIDNDNKITIKEFHNVK